MRFAVHIPLLLANTIIALSLPANTMRSPVHIPLLLAFTLLTIYLPTPFAATCHADDEAGLLAFKAGIKTDPSGMLANWIKGTDCCNWFGITCLTGNRVTSLSLGGQPNNQTTSLSGTISPVLAKLAYLDSIYLQDLKNLAGTFPDFIFSLPRILYVYIENNKLSGTIPEKIGESTQLGAFSLMGNQFSGHIPSSIGNLEQLSQLVLGGNRLTGKIPATIQRLRNLTYLNLENNQLSGSIPDIFSGLTDLRDLELSYNNFTGGIPRSISALAPNLRYLELGHNSLTGRIPDFLSNFRSLDTLDLSWNRFSGTVPKTFANLTKIFNLNLAHNKLVDPFPVLNVRGIESLDLSYNNFHLGSIPQWVTTSTIIYSLKLAKCGIKMKLDEWKPTETYFYDYIDLSENEITGSPVSLLNRTDYLVGFSASGNKLKFNFESLRFVERLKYLDLSRNLVFGKVPAAAAGLTELNVSNNHLCGRLPATKFPASAFVGNVGLCGPPLPKCKALGFINVRTIPV